MQIDLSRVSDGDSVTLANLFQFYVYDMSDVADRHCNADGRFDVPSFESNGLDIWRQAHLVRVGGNLAGFALVQKRSRITGDDNTWDMDQFFIMQRYRRSGVGANVAIRLFESLRGPWEVRELPTNHRAIAFWRRVIGTYTNGNFKEEIFDDQRWHGPVQSFES
jgi:predicted acetyltransferase